MSQLEKALEKFFRTPEPKDITVDELKCVVEHYGMIMEIGKGKHGVKIRYRPKNIKIPIPIHGKEVQVVYIKQIKNAINEITEDQEAE